jgi:hypothetical protein
MSPLLNYTTSVPARRTVSEVQELLVQAGARSVLAEYDDGGHCSAIGFSLRTPLGMRHFRLPVNASAVAKVVAKDLARTKAHVNRRELGSADQAERIAWRIVKDWVEAQLAITRTEMVTLDQVMLPYMTAPDGRTVYDLYREHALPLEGGEETLQVPERSLGDASHRPPPS